MLDHFGFVVKDLERAASFYEKCLAQINLKVIERHDYGAVVFARSVEQPVPFIWMGTAQPDFWNKSHSPSCSPIHLCFKAKNKDEVDKFFVAAIASGGKDNGKPGPRGPSYYAAYVIDPDGNNVEVSVRVSKQ